MRVQDIHSRSYWQHMARGLIAVAVALALTHIFSSTWVVRKVEQSNLWAFFHLHPIERDSRLMVVTIDENDYRTLFHNRSPLDKQKLLELVQAIQDGGATAIGVDVVSDGWTAGDVAQKNFSVPVVLVSSGISEDDLNNDPRGIYGKNFCSSAPRIEHHDGLATEYYQYFNTPAGTLPSFTSLVVQATNIGAPACRQMSEPKSDQYESGQHESAEAREISYLGMAKDYDSSSATNVLTAARGFDWKQQGVFRGRTVLVGVTFPASRDIYPTAFGKMPGVYILANIVSSELRSLEVVAAPRWCFVLLDFLFGVVALTLSYLLRRHNRILAFALTMVCVPLAAILLSFAFFVLGYKCLFYLSFVPVTVGVLMHALVEHFEDYWHLYKHCAHCPAFPGGQKQKH